MGEMARMGLLPDATVELDEDVDLTLIDGTVYNVGTPGSASGEPMSLCQDWPPKIFSIR